MHSQGIAGFGAEPMASSRFCVVYIMLVLLSLCLSSASVVVIVVLPLPGGPITVSGLSPRSISILVIFFIVFNLRGWGLVYRLARVLQGVPLELSLAAHAAFIWFRATFSSPGLFMGFDALSLFARCFFNALGLVFCRCCDLPLPFVALVLVFFCAGFVLLVAQGWLALYFSWFLPMYGFWARGVG